MELETLKLAQLAPFLTLVMSRNNENEIELI